MTTIDAFGSMPDDRLLSEVRRLAATERGVKAEFIRAIEQVDARRLYLGQGCSSLFAYCTRVLYLSEHAAYGRIEAARSARRFPLILDLLAVGDITLTTITLLAPHLTEENHQAVLDEARHRSRRDVERIVARLRPGPDVAPSVRQLPEPPAREVPAANRVTAHLPSNVPTADVAERPAPRPAVAVSRDVAPPRPVVRPLSPARYSLKLTMGQDVHDMLDRAQALLRHAVPDGDLAVVFERALRALLRELERDRLALVSRPRAASRSTKRSRHILADVRRAVWRRDEGRCAFLGADERRCGATAFLELHHLVPFTDGGAATVDNLSLRCRAHNQYEADLWSGVTLVRETVAHGRTLGADRATGPRPRNAPPSHALDQ